MRITHCRWSKTFYVCRILHGKTYYIFRRLLYFIRNIWLQAYMVYKYNSSLKTLCVKKFEGDI